ncbi:hypothetical protein K8I85_18880, partial [bacterium]|nr:hypothetical protein [bacterium]
MARCLASADSLRAADEVVGAIAELRRALESEGSLPASLAAEIRLRLADCTYDANDHEASRAVLGPLLDNPPDSIWRARALVRLGRELFVRGDAEATQTACTEAAQILNPTSHHEELALAQLWGGQAHEALGETALAR